MNKHPIPPRASATIRVPDRVKGISRRTLLAGAAAVALLAACGGDEAKDEGGNSGDHWEFVDDRGITVSLDRRPERIVAQTNAAAALWDLGVRPVGVFGPQRRADGSTDPLIGDVDLNTVRSVGEKHGEIDLEKLAALRPDLIVSTVYVPPDLWYVPADIAPELAAIAPTVGISVAERPVTGPIARFGELAQALGADLNAPEVVTARRRFETTSAGLKDATAAKPGLKVLVATASLETLWIAYPPQMADLQHFQQQGLDIVVPANPEGYFEALSWEQALKYPADLILYDTRSHAVPPAQLAAKVATWSQHPAVKAGQVAPWRAEARLSYQGMAGIIEELVQTVHTSRADIV